MSEQPDLFETEAARSLLDQLLADSRLYKTTKDYRNLLDFVVRLRNFAPFNAMLLNMQKPGLTYAASAADWRDRFGRKPKEGARPLLILWPFGPVALVYDVMDTEGAPLPSDVGAFPATGNMDEKRLAEFRRRVVGRHIEWHEVDAGDGKAGSIRVLKRPTSAEKFTQYRMHVNRNHDANVQFTTLAHELGHLFLGHLGPDKFLNIPERSSPTHVQRELEAESVAYLVCCRIGIRSKSEKYLADYVENNKAIESLDIYQVLRAAGQVETLLGLTAHTKYDKPVRTKKATNGNQEI